MLSVLFRARVVLLVLMCGVVASSVGAVLLAAARQTPANQGQAAPPKPTQPAPAPAAGQTPPAEGIQLPKRPTFAVEVNLVTTDVIARDKAGQFITDLDKKEFDVLEDGVKQEIASLVLVHGGRVFKSELPPPPPSEEGIILPPSRPPQDTAGRVFLLFVDDLHLDFRNTARIRELFKKISKNLIHEGDMFGIVSTGPSSLAIDLTYDKKRLDEAISKISGNGLKPTDIIQGADGAEGPTEVRYRAHVAFSTALDLVSNLERLQNRRKAVVYVSNGYDFNPFSKARNCDPSGGGFFETSTNCQNQAMTSDGSNQYQEDPSKQGQQFADADLARDLSELSRAANRANATFYTIDPRGLVGGPDIDENVDPTEWNDYVRKSQDSLRAIAELTGGIAVVNQNDFDRALKRIDAETSDYYMLGYYSSNPDPTKRTRKLEVKVTRPDVDVWSRTSYSMKLPAPPKSK